MSDYLQEVEWSLPQVLYVHSSPPEQFSSGKAPN